MWRRVARLVEREQKDRVEGYLARVCGSIGAGEGVYREIAYRCRASVRS